MKNIIIILIIIAWVSAGFSQNRIGSSFLIQSYYGFSGLMFIPTAQKISPTHLSISYSTKPNVGSELTLIPFSVRIAYSPRIEGLELALTNTPYYASAREYEGVSINNTLPDSIISLPIYPSLKYQLMPMKKDNHYVGMAIGIALPYGGYYVVDKFFNIKYFDVTVHTGVATKLITYHTFIGLTFTFGERISDIQRDFPMDLLLESGWGGSLKQLDKKEEAFFSVAVRQVWTPDLYITTFLRVDYQPLIEEDKIVSNSPTTRMGIGLDYRWY
jgi:hypothetical protein